MSLPLTPTIIAALVSFTQVVGRTWQYLTMAWYILYNKVLKCKRGFTFTRWPKTWIQMNDDVIALQWIAACSNLAPKPMLMLGDSANPWLQSVIFLFPDSCISLFFNISFSSYYVLSLRIYTHLLLKEVKDCYDCEGLDCKQVKTLDVASNMAFSLTASLSPSLVHRRSHIQFVCTHKMHTYYSTYTHPTHTNCSSWSLTRQSVRFRLLSNISSSSHQPIVRSLFVLTYLDRN